MNKLTKRLIAFSGVNLGVIGLVFLFIFYLSIVSIPAVKLLGQCIFAKTLHMYCPGCGGTRALASLLRLDFLSSLRYNPLVLSFIALFVYCDIKALTNIIKGKDKVFNFNVKLLYVILAIVFAFFILRNALMIFWHFDPVGDYADFWR